MDEDLDRLDHAGLLAETKRLRAGIRRHRDASGQDLCWYHPDLWGLLPDTPTPPTVPAWPTFLAGCLKYRASLGRSATDA